MSILMGAFLRVVWRRVRAVRVAGDVLRVLGAVLGRRADHPVRAVPSLAACFLRRHPRRGRRRDMLPRWVSLYPMIISTSNINTNNILCYERDLKTHS